MSTRAQILEYLQKKGPASAGELARALKTTLANVRHHLSILEQEGVVEVAAQRPPGGRGRPSLLYDLTRRVRSHNLDLLASALLKTLLVPLPPAERAASLRQVACHLAGESPPPALHLTRRLNAAVERLKRLNYQARWEAHAQAPHVLLGHCPYSAILPQHPELCQMDGFLLEALCAAPARLVKKLASDGRGGTYCLFLIGPGESPTPGNE
jgi:predicted ArsR family transcriptional regulator